MHTHKAGDCRSRVHWQRASSVAATFIAAFLAPYHFLVNAVHHQTTHLTSIHLSNDHGGRGKSSARLDAAQNKEVDQTYRLVREIAERTIIPLLRRVEAEDQRRRLVCFDRRFKDANRLKHKVADQLRLAPSCTPSEGLAVIPDAVRFTLQYLESDYVTGVRKDIERFRDRGCTLVAVRNAWAGDQYKGINSRWRDPSSGLMFEVQFHTQDSLRARELTHRAYERIRGDTVMVEGTEMTTLRAFQRQVNAMVLIPPGALEIGESNGLWVYPAVLSPV